MTRIPCLLLAGCVALVGCAKPKFNAAEESAKVLARDAEWSRLSSAGKDTDAVVEFWSENAVLALEGETQIQGRPAIRQFVAASFRTPGFNIQWKSDHVDFSPDGKMAYTQSYTVVTAPGPTGALEKFPERGLVIWRLESDGQWRCVVDFSNRLPTTGPPPVIPAASAPPAR